MSALRNFPNLSRNGRARVMQVVVSEGCAIKTISNPASTSSVKYKAFLQRQRTSKMHQDMPARGRGQGVEEVVPTLLVYAAFCPNGQASHALFVTHQCSGEGVLFLGDFTPIQT